MTATPPKILLATFGSLGDLHPFIALAHALARDGFRPVIATTPVYADFLAGEGVEIAPVLPDLAEVEARLGLDVAGIARRMAEDDAFLFSDVIFPFLKGNLDSLLAACEGADVVVAHSLAFAARLAAEIRQIPLINVHLSPLLLYSAIDPPRGRGSPFIGEPRFAASVAWNRALLWSYGQAMGLWATPLRRIRRDLGLPRKWGFELMFAARSARATIGLFTPLLAPPQPDHAPTLTIAGHTFHDRCSPMEREGDRAGVEAFVAAGPPPIVFTLGSLVSRDAAGYFSACAEAATRLGRRAVLLAHDSDVPALAAAAPPGVLATGYLPHSVIFPAAAVVVHHGGIGTSGQALRAGRPQLVTPWLADQFDNAVRLSRLGVAEAIDGADVTPDALARKLAPLLAEPGYAARAGEAGRTIGKENGAATAAHVIARAIDPTSIARQ